MTQKAVYIHDIKLSGDSDFVERFNSVSDSWEKAHDESLTEEERKQHLDDYWGKKYCLEQGI